MSVRVQVLGCFTCEWSDGEQCNRERGDLVLIDDALVLLPARSPQSIQVR
jgi:hypothetical protein